VVDLTRYRFAGPSRVRQWEAESWSLTQSNLYRLGLIKQPQPETSPLRLFIALGIVLAHQQCELIIKFTAE
jgi:hypothetical protein